MYENDGVSRQASCPTNLVPAVKALRESFEDGHWQMGRLTQVICYSMLHRGDPKELEEYLLPLRQTKQLVGPVAVQRFHDLLKRNIPPAIFKAFFKLYLEGSALAEAGRSLQ